MLNHKALKQILAAIVAGCLFAPGAQADDELIDLLGGKSAETAKAAGEQSVFAKVMKAEIGKLSAEQNIFLQFLESREFEKALYQIPAAFDGTDFATKPSGIALNAYVLYKNGLTITGVEKLLLIAKPELISKDLLLAFRDIASDSAPVWSLINPELWKPFWSQTFGIGVEVRVRGRGAFASASDDELREMIKKTQVDTKERAWLTWQLIARMAVGADPGTAGKALAALMKTGNNPVSNDLMTMTAARMLYQNGFLDAAQKYYEKIPKNSDYWFEAQEEIAWGYLRKGEPQNASAISKTLVATPFASLVGPESFFLQTLSQLKVCDYPNVLTSMNNYRDRFKPKAKVLQELSETGRSEALTKFISRAKQKSLKLNDLGNLADQLPRYLTRDEVLLQNLETEKALEQEARLAGELYARSLEGGTGQVGFQARLEFFKKAADSRLESARALTASRVKELASEEVAEIQAILQKMHIAEAELIQQVSQADRVIGATTGKTSEKTGMTGGKSRDRLTFPVEKETWFDEYSNYRMDIKKGCFAGAQAQKKSSVQ